MISYTWQFGSNHGSVTHQLYELEQITESQFLCLKKRNERITEMLKRYCIELAKKFVWFFSCKMATVALS